MAAKKPHPRTGEKRATAQPLKIDRLPPAVLDAILYLRNTRGRTWGEIEAQSAATAEPWADDWAATGKCFIDWPSLPLDVLELFPDMRLSHTSLHRWHDLRVEQVSREVLHRAQQARVVAEAFAKATLVGDEEAVINAARDTLMGVLAEDGSAKGRANVARSLVKLGELMQTARANDLSERKVSVEERRIAQLEKDAELKRKRMEAETEVVAKKMSKGELTLDDINKLRKNTFGLPPLEAGAAVTAGAKG